VPLLTVADARQAALDALAPRSDDDPNVQMTADAVSPPTLVVYWAEPWLEPATSSGLRLACSFTAHLSVLAIAGRIEPADGIAELEQLVSLVVSRLAADGYDWPSPIVGTPLRWRPWQSTQSLEYLAADIRYRTPVYLEGA
jgi:hypothetical protein